jgi:hypothetical protein
MTLVFVAVCLTKQATATFARYNTFELMSRIAAAHLGHTQCSRALEETIEGICGRLNSEVLDNIFSTSQFKTNALAKAHRSFMDGPLAPLSKTFSGVSMMSPLLPSASASVPTSVLVIP